MELARQELLPEARSVSLARRAVSSLVTSAGAEEWLDATALAVSEVVTNAVVHAGAGLTLAAWAGPDGVRVEVGDASTHLPDPRQYAVTAGTGRGLVLLDSSVDRWGWASVAGGKVVWFELGKPAATPGAVRDGWEDAATHAADDGPGPDGPDGPGAVVVRLRNVPLLMHWAWQEHAQALLREHLLHTLDTDPGALDTHVEAGEALAVLRAHVPLPALPDDPDELLAGALEPGVSLPEVDVVVPVVSVPHFATLDTVLAAAGAAAEAGLFLGPPTQPEIAEMRAWLCAEVARQAQQDPAGTGDAAPQPWAPRLEVDAVLADDLAREAYRPLLESEEALIATDEASIIVAVSARAVAFLGYRSADDLVGRRVIVVVPRRYHQAHIAGTTLHATNGRDQLLDVPLTVPVVRADGSEAPVELRVVPRRLDDDHRVFVATLGLPEH